MSLTPLIRFIKKLTRGQSPLTNNAAQAILMKTVPQMMYNFSKRSLDLAGCFAVFVLAFPVWPLLLLLVRCQIGSPVFFRQIRPGLNGKPFKMIKFRTMTDKRDEHGIMLEDSHRMTRFGLFFRSTSLDELPEFWNVLKGEMSLVGPRPLLMEYLPLYNDQQAKRHCVKPGITGWAQVHGRNAIGWDERFELDTWYVNNRTIWLDCQILLMTIGKVLKRDGVADVGHVTKEKFSGSPSSSEMS